MMTEEAFLDFPCPHCGEIASFPQEHAGLVEECPNCTEPMLVPREGGQAACAIPLPISTDRLVLRRLHGLDWKDLAEFLGDEELFRYLEGRPLGEEEITRWLEADQHLKLTTPDQPFCLAIEVQANHKVVGYLSLRFTDHLHQAILTLLVNRQYQHQGFGTEAVQAILSFCFAGLGLHRLSACCDSRNTAGCRLLEKTGFRREGQFVQDRFVNGEWTDTVWYALLGKEYRQTPPT